MKKKKKDLKKIDKAVAVITDPCSTPAQMADCGHKRLAAMQKSPLWATLPADVQQGGIDLDTASTNIEENDALIVTLLAQVDTARANHLILLRRWVGKKRACLTKVTDYADGSKDTVINLGFAVFVSQPLPPSGVPENLRDKHSKVHGEAHGQWDRGLTDHDYMVQHATDPTNPATHSTPVAVSKVTFKLSAQIPGALVYLRVLAIDPKLPTGQSDYTTWVPVMAGA